MKRNKGGNPVTKTLARTGAATPPSEDLKGNKFHFDEAGKLVNVELSDAFLTLLKKSDGSPIIVHRIAAATFEDKTGKAYRDFISTKQQNNEAVIDWPYLNTPDQDVWKTICENLQIRLDSECNHRQLVTLLQTRLASHQIKNGHITYILGSRAVNHIFTDKMLPVLCFFKKIVMLTPAIKPRTLQPQADLPCDFPEIVIIAPEKDPLFPPIDRRFLMAKIYQISKSITVRLVLFKGGHAQHWIKNAVYPAIADFYKPAGEQFLSVTRYTYGESSLHGIIIRIENMTPDQFHSVVDKHLLEDDTKQINIIVCSHQGKDIPINYCNLVSVGNQRVISIRRTNYPIDCIRKRSNAANFSGLAGENGRSLVVFTKDITEDSAIVSRLRSNPCIKSRDLAAESKSFVCFNPPWGIDLNLPNYDFRKFISGKRERFDITLRNQLGHTPEVKVREPIPHHKYSHGRLILPVCGQKKNEIQTEQTLDKCTSVTLGCKTQVPNTSFPIAFVGLKLELVSQCRGNMKSVNTVNLTADKDDIASINRLCIQPFKLMAWALQQAKLPWTEWLAIPRPRDNIPIIAMRDRRAFTLTLILALRALLRGKDITVNGNEIYAYIAAERAFYVDALTEDTKSLITLVIEMYKKHLNSSHKISHNFKRVIAVFSQYIGLAMGDMMSCWHKSDHKSCSSFTHSIQQDDTKKGLIDVTLEQRHNLILTILTQPTHLVPKFEDKFLGKIVFGILSDPDNHHRQSLIDSTKLLLQNGYNEVFYRLVNIVITEIRRNTCKDNTVIDSCLGFFEILVNYKPFYQKNYTSYDLLFARGDTSAMKAIKALDSLQPTPKETSFGEDQFENEEHLKACLLKALYNKHETTCFYYDYLFRIGDEKKLLSSPCINKLLMRGANKQDALFLFSLLSKVTLEKYTFNHEELGAPFSQTFHDVIKMAPAKLQTHDEDYRRFIENTALLALYLISCAKYKAESSLDNYLTPDFWNIFTNASDAIQVRLCESNPKLYFRHASEAIQMKLCESNPKLYLRHASKVIQMKRCESNPKLYLRHASKVIQMRLCESNPKLYFRHASEAIQMKLCESNPKLYLRYAPEAIQMKLCESNPKLYFRHASEAIQMKLCESNPKLYLRHASKVIQMKLCESNPKLYLRHAPDAIQMKRCESNPKLYFRHAPDAIQMKLCESNPKLYFRHAPDAIQMKLFESNPKLYFGHASKAIQMKLCKSNPEIYLWYAPEAIQMELCESNPKLYFRHASKAIQMKLCKSNPEIYLWYAPEAIQMELCESNPKLYFRHASEAMQMKLCKSNPEIYLWYAPEAIQIELCKSNPEIYLWYAPEAIQMKLCESFLKAKLVKASIVRNNVSSRSKPDRRKKKQQLKKGDIVELDARSKMRHGIIWGIPKKQLRSRNKKRKGKITVLCTTGKIETAKKCFPFKVDHQAGAYIDAIGSINLLEGIPPGPVHTEIAKQVVAYAALINYGVPSDKRTKTYLKALDSLFYNIHSNSNPKEDLRVLRNTLIGSGQLDKASIKKAINAIRFISWRFRGIKPKKIKQDPRKQAFFTNVVEILDIKTSKTKLPESWMPLSMDHFDGKDLNPRPEAHLDQHEVFSYALDALFNAKELSFSKKTTAPSSLQRTFWIQPANDVKKIVITPGMIPFKKISVVQYNGHKKDFLVYCRIFKGLFYIVYYGSKRETTMTSTPFLVKLISLPGFMKQSFDYPFAELDQLSITQVPYDAKLINLIPDDKKSMAYKMAKASSQLTSIRPKKWRVKNPLATSSSSTSFFLCQDDLNRYACTSKKHAILVQSMRGCM